MEVSLLTWEAFKHLKSRQTNEGWGEPFESLVPNILFCHCCMCAQLHWIWLGWYIQQLENRLQNVANGTWVRRREKEKFYLLYEVGEGSETKQADAATDFPCYFICTGIYWTYVPWDSHRECSLTLYQSIRQLNIDILRWFWCYYTCLFPTICQASPVQLEKQRQPLYQWQ